MYHENVDFQVSPKQTFFILATKPKNQFLHHPNQNISFSEPWTALSITIHGITLKISLLFKLSGSCFKRGRLEFQVTSILKKSNQPALQNSGIHRSYLAVLLTSGLNKPPKPELGSYVCKCSLLARRSCRQLE